MKHDVVIIGTGHNGLAAAFYLARKGLDVHLVGARNPVGGACVTEELIPGFRFSSCANVACWLRPQITEDMRLMERGVEFWGYDVFVNPLAGGESFIQWSDASKQHAEIARFSQADAEAWPRWNQFWRQAADLFGPYLLTPPPTLADLFARARQLNAEEFLTTILTTSVA